MSVVLTRARAPAPTFSRQGRGARFGAIAVAALVLRLLVGGAPAIAAGRPARPNERAAAALRAGRYEEARRWAERGGRRLIDPASTLVSAQAEQALGQDGAARDRLEKAVDRLATHLPLRRALCELLAAHGDRAGLKFYLDLTYEDWRAHRIDAKSAEDLLAVAAILRLDDNWQDANDLLRAAVRADPHNPRPNVFWGQVFLEKHAAAEAEASFRAALAVDPDNPDAHVGLAQVHLLRRYDVAAADAESAAALRINSRHAAALALRAEVALDGEDFETTSALIAAIRRTNPHQADAAWLAAARARLLDDEAEYRRERDAHAAVHPGDGDFFAAVADVLIKHRRTEDARTVAEEGVAADRANARCQSMLGTTLLRLGNEQAGVEALRRAWSRDPYDARTFNLLELYEKVIPHMETFTTPHLTFRIDPDARVAVERVVAPFLEETYARYVAKYGFQPRGPIVFELYRNPDAFAVRTVGMPGIGVEAVCFGRVITSQSPTNAAMNWGMVLSHELAHAFAIELSRSRVPRWFTEGLSELETMRARPEWARHAERSLWGAARRDELGTLATLSNAFVRARDAEEATRAYAQAAAVLDYLDRRFGFSRIREALVRFGSGARGPGVVAGAMGVTEEELERGFRADLTARGAGFDGQYLPTEGPRRPASADPSESPQPAAGDRADREARQGLAQLRQGDVAEAARALGRARDADVGRDRRAVLFLTGELALAQRQADQARGAFQRLLESPPEHPGDAATGDGYDVRVRLALAEIRRGDLSAAEGHLRRAIAFDPGSAEATGLLVELLGDAQWRGARDEDRLSAIWATLRLEPLHAPLARELILGLAQRRRFSDVSAAAPLAIFIDPGRAALHAALGRALIQLGQPAAASGALQRALALAPAAPDADELRKLLAGADLKRADSRSPPPPAMPPAPR